METTDSLLLHSLRQFYSKEAHAKALREVLCGHAGAVSLRALDWLCTNFARKNNSIIYEAESKILHIHIDYKAQLKSFSKRNFDCFKRRNRIAFPLDGTDPGGVYETTVAQLNFFRWAIRSGVLRFCKSHLSEIEADMNESMKQRAKTGNRKKRSTGVAARTLTCSTPLRVRVCFD
jgi:hypothetical protein